MLEVSDRSHIHVLQNTQSYYRNLGQKKKANVYRSCIDKDQ